MVDMRRYLRDAAAFTSLTNLTSTVITRLNDRPQERFESTLGRVKAVMDAKKGADIGLNGFMKLDLAGPDLRGQDRPSAAPVETE